ncbi:MAG: putative glutamine amidotransferase [Gammaproteobacteria bacterium]|jgi:predicted glutamine amidotransferase
MCRVLFVRGDQPFDPLPHLAALAKIARDSKEYQGHGWGYAWPKAGGGWNTYHDIRPIWEDPTLADAACFAHTRVLVAHARSAFHDEGIVVENNMPFVDETCAFIFNGELRGVRIKAEGRIGAEKIFNYLKRFHKGALHEAVLKGSDIINRRTRYVRAMNMVVVDAQQAVVSCHYGEDPNYFQLRHTKRDGLDMVCSQSYPSDCGGDGAADDSWQRMNNGETLTFALPTATNTQAEAKQN